MFSEKQLDFLMTAQYGEDWHPSYFPVVLKDLDCSEIDLGEREILIQYVGLLSVGQVSILQMALNHLNQLPTLAKTK